MILLNDNAVKTEDINWRFMGKSFCACMVLNFVSFGGLPI